MCQFQALQLDDVCLKIERIPRFSTQLSSFKKLLAAFRICKQVDFYQYDELFAKLAERGSPVTEKKCGWH